MTAHLDHYRQTRIQTVLRLVDLQSNLVLLTLPLTVRFVILVSLAPDQMPVRRFRVTLLLQPALARALIFVRFTIRFLVNVDLRIDAFVYCRELVTRVGLLVPLLQRNGAFLAHGGSATVLVDVYDLRHPLHLVRFPLQRLRLLLVLLVRDVFNGGRFDGRLVLVVTRLLLHLLGPVGGRGWRWIRLDILVRRVHLRQVFVRLVVGRRIPGNFTLIFVASFEQIRLERVGAVLLYARDEELHFRFNLRHLVCHGITGGRVIGGCLECFLTAGRRVVGRRFRWITTTAGAAAAGWIFFFRMHLLIPIASREFNLILLPRRRFLTLVLHQ